MRYAGERFREPRHRMPKQKAERGQAQSGRSPYVNPTGTAAMTQMREINADQMAFTVMPQFSNPPFNIGSFSEPQFQAPSRI